MKGIAMELGDRNQMLSLSPIGGTVTGWKYRGVDIFYPQQSVLREGEVKVRGGMHVCFPSYGTTDTRFGLPKHGVLRGRIADTMTARGFKFRGNDLLGPACNAECAVEVTVELLKFGFTYTLAARLTKKGSAPAFVNPGLHPYFRTPTGNAQVYSFAANETVRVYDRVFEPRFLKVEDTANVIVPGVGSVTMSLDGSWGVDQSRGIMIWRDSRNYVCAEPVAGHSKRFGRQNHLQLSDQEFRISCTFQVSPED